MNGQIFADKWQVSIKSIKFFVHFQPCLWLLKTDKWTASFSAKFLTKTVYKLPILLIFWLSLKHWLCLAFRKGCYDVTLDA
jgi:hypothetical protein